MIKIRASSLPSYADCPRRASCGIVSQAIADAGYTVKPNRAGIGAAVGIGFHESAAHISTEKMVRGAVPAKLDDAIEKGIVKYHEEIADGVEFDATTDSNNTAEKQIIRITRCFASDVITNITPVNIEVRRIAPLSDDFELTGRLDAETDSDEITDWKSGARRPVALAQMGGYSLLRRTVTETAAQSLSLFHLPRTNIKKVYPGATRIEYPVDVAEREAYIVSSYIMRDVRAFLKTGNPNVFACNAMSMMCSEKYCRAFGTDYCGLWKIK